MRECKDALYKYGLPDGVAKYSREVQSTKFMEHGVRLCTADITPCPACYAGEQHQHGGSDQ
eukprot:1737639-Amphidinium_carterae.2